MAETRYWRCRRCGRLRDTNGCVCSVYSEMEPVVILPAAEYERLTRPGTQHCPVCEATAREPARLKQALSLAEAEGDYCWVCNNHPSHGHSKDCPMRDYGEAP